MPQAISFGWSTEVAVVLSLLKCLSLGCSGPLIKCCFAALSLLSGVQ